MTNREWLASLTDSQLAAFFTHGLLVRQIAFHTDPFPISIHDINGKYMQSSSGMEFWLSIPQSYRCVEDVYGGNV